MILNGEYYSRWQIPLNLHEILNLKIDQEPHILLKCKQWMENDEPYCVLAGDNGTGKTTLACHMLKAWMKENENKGPSGRFVKQSMIYHQWLSEMRSGSVYMLLERFREYDILVIDDLGIKDPSSGWREWIICLIDQRLDDCKKTIVTTNLNAEGIKTFYGETMLSRLLVGTQIKITGEDRRKNKTAKSPT